MATIGQRIYELRTDRIPRLTQHQLAERAHVSVDVVQKLEQGRKQSARITTLTAIARALDADLAELVGKPTRLAHLPDDGGLLELRRALTPVGDAGPPADVAAELAEAWPLYWSGDYDQLAATLPGILAAAAGDQRAEAHALAASALVHLGHCDLALLALRDADAAVRDPLLATELAWTRAWVLLCQGRPEDGAAVAVRELDGMRLGRQDRPQRVSAWGILAVTAASAAARAGEGGQASELLRVAHGAVALLGEDRTDHHTAFGASKVTMMQVDCAVVAGDYAGALEAADRMPPGAAGLPTASRARHLTDVAYAHARLGHRDRAEQMVLQVGDEAPRWISYQAFPRALIGELVSRRRPSPRLLTLARRLGIDRTQGPTHEVIAGGK